MERVRVDDCTRIIALTRGLEKLSRDLVEAAERTPYTVTSRQILEELEKLSHSLLALSRGLMEGMEC